MPRTVAIGSTNPIKVEAVRQVVTAVWPDATMVPLEVESGVGAMPMSDEAGKAGAVERARAALRALDADIAVGLEGAVVDTPAGMYVTNWVAVAQRDGRISVANGGRLPLPEIIARKIRQGAELGPIIDRYTGQEGSKQHMGAAGYLTGGIVPRELAFRIAVAFALAPYIHPELYAAHR
ncbi:MAG: inosine/xanthosine triphosphatase [Anaerolineae bacterium]|jgi:inosine/xanthosine triphosphatase